MRERERGMGDRKYQQREETPTFSTIPTSWFGQDYAVDRMAGPCKDVVVVAHGMLTTYPIQPLPPVRGGL